VLMAASGSLVKSRKSLEDTLFTNGTVPLGLNKTVELWLLQLPLMAILGLSPIRARSGELLMASGRTLLDALERFQSALTEPPTFSDA